MSITDHTKQRYGTGPGWARPAIADHRIRAAVWSGLHSGTWHVDVYYAVRRAAGSVVLRSDIDGADDAPVIERTFSDRAGALAWAGRTVGMMRATVGIAAGALATDDALAALGTVKPGDAAAALDLLEPMEAP